MKRMKYLLSALALCLAGMPAAQANKVVQQVTGIVTAPLVGHSISIDGKTYVIPGSGPNLDALSSLNVGDQVNLGYTGTPGTRNWHVLSVTPVQSK